MNNSSSIPAHSFSPHLPFSISARILAKLVFHLALAGLAPLLLAGICSVRQVLAAYALSLIPRVFHACFAHRLCLLGLAVALVSLAKNSSRCLIGRIDAKCLVGFSDWWILLAWIARLAAGYRFFFSGSLCLLFGLYLFLKFNLGIVVALAFSARNNQLESFDFDLRKNSPGVTFVQDVYILWSTTLYRSNFDRMSLGIYSTCFQCHGLLHRHIYFSLMDGCREARSGLLGLDHLCFRNCLIDCDFLGLCNFELAVNLRKMDWVLVGNCVEYSFVGNCVEFSFVGNCVDFSFVVGGRYLVVILESFGDWNFADNWYFIGEWLKDLFMH